MHPPREKLMGLYDRHVLPRLMHTAMSTGLLADYRRRTAAHAQGVVLELGFGSGLNLPFYDSSRISRLYALEPSDSLFALATGRIDRTPLSIEVLRTGAEHIPLADASIDTVLCTWTLCSIAAVQQALLEVCRVLRPDGRFVFVEHGLSPEPRVAHWQRRITPVWRRCAGGCHLDRKADDLIGAAGLRVVGLSTSYVGPVKTLGFMSEGCATR